jgi:hypothetical protein
MARTVTPTPDTLQEHKVNLFSKPNSVDIKSVSIQSSIKLSYFSIIVE